MPGPAIRSPTGSVDHRTMRRIRVSCLLPCAPPSSSRRSTPRSSCSRRSRASSGRRLPVEVVVVDNASTDGTAETIAERHPDVRVLRNERNLGFGAAVNRAALSADGDVARARQQRRRVCARVRRVAARAVRGPGRGHGRRRPPAGGRAGPHRLGRDRARHHPRVVGLPVERAGRRRSAGAGDPVGPCGGAAAYRLARVPGSSAASTRRSSPTGRTSTWRLRFRGGGLALRARGRRASAAQARPDARGGVTGRPPTRGVRSRLRAREVRRRAPPPADAASRSRCSTGPSSPSTSSFGARRAASVSG